MITIVVVLAGSLAITAVFIAIAYDKLTSRRTYQLSGGRHRNPNNLRKKRGEPVELITTGEIYRMPEGRSWTDDDQKRFEKAWTKVFDNKE